MKIPIIPRKVLFDNPDRAQVKISPDGNLLAWLAPLNGVLNVWVAPRNNLEDAQPITHDTGRGIRFYFWAYTNQHIIYGQDKDGDENWRVYTINLNDNQIKDLTPLENTQAQIYGISHKHPKEIIIGLNDRNPQWHDLYQINILNGKRTLLLQNDRFAGFVLDDDNCIRQGIVMTPDGGIDVLILKPDSNWEKWEDIPAEDILTTNSVEFDKSGQRQYIKDSRGRDTSALFVINLETHEKELLAEDSRADVADVLIHPTEKHIQAVSFIYAHKRWEILDASIEPDWTYLDTVIGDTQSEVEIVSRSLDDQTWIVLYHRDDSPAQFYLYDRKERGATFLFSNRKALEGQPLVKMHSVVLKARDGLDLVCYYSLPPGSDSNNDGIPDEPVPMVLNPHGGPWHRDFWGYAPWHQWLANRGYAVLCVNFRSSTGFGKNFVNAGNLEWGGKIMEDQQDTIQWAIQKGIADPQKVAVMGGSFGGYSTLAGLTFYPDVFACGVDLVGPSSLITLLESMPPYWKPTLEMFTTRVGDHRTEEGQALLTKHSPLTYTDRIIRPLLIGQGANDPRVKQSESDQIVAAMQAKNIPVTYVLYPDEGHGFARPENSLSFNAIAEAFLAKCLGGRYEPIGNDFENSSLEVLNGAKNIPGLPEALVLQN